MEFTHDFTTDSARLAGVVRGVRNRWRLKRVLRGATIALAVGFLALVASAFLIDALRYGETAVLAARIGVAVVVAALAGYFVVLPLLPVRAPDDKRVALYLEEHEPSLDAAVVTAVELNDQQAMARVEQRGTPLSPSLFKYLLQNALERTRKVDDGAHVDEREVRFAAGGFACVAGVALLATLFGPSSLRTGLKLMLTPWGSDTPANIYSIIAEPGNVTVARGGDLLVAARLKGFQSDQVDLLVRQRDSASFTRLPMGIDSTGRYAGRYTFRLFDITAPMEYAIESNGVRSPVYKIDVADVPYAKKIGLDYHFPAYSGLAPQTVDEGGDIAALRGTQVRVRVTTTVPAKGGRLIVDAGKGGGSDTVKLVPAANGVLVGTIRVDKPGFYKVELEAQDGRIFPGSLDYTVDVLPDRAPTVSISKPGRDAKVLSVDEVYTEVQAEDDYGLQKLELVYSVNGGDEKTVKLFDQADAKKRSPQMSAGHTFNLEDFNLQPGDVVSYYGRATDNDAVSGNKTAVTDIYFLTVRPFAQEYSQNQAGGGGGGGGGGEQQGQLSQRQREIIAGTFNTVRDRASKQQKELEENLSTLRLSQQALREQVEELQRRLVDRGIAAKDSNFKKIADILAKTVPIMDSAEKQLAAGDPQKAMGPEQRALQQLQRAEAVFREVRVSMGGEGGGGGGQGQRAEDLADLFELKKDQLRNQYESVQRGREQQQAADQQVDETLEKLRRLSARQQQENERAQRKADSLAAATGQRMGASGSSGGASQRQLAQDAEEAARQLERLARERQQQQQQQNSSGGGSQSSSGNQSSQSSGSQSSGAQSSQSQNEARAMAEAARRLREAADAMRRSASSSPDKASADGQAALQRLEDARRLLDNERSGRLSRNIEDAQRTARQLAEQEREIASDLNKMRESNDQQSRADQARSLLDRKGQMADKVRDLKGQLDRAALDAKGENAEAARGIEEAAQSMRDRKLEEKVRASQRVLNSNPDYAKMLEDAIGADISDLQQRLDQAANAARNGQGANTQRQADALDRTRQLVRGLSSVDERLRNRAAQGQQGQEGQGQNAQGQNQQGRNGQNPNARGQQPGREGQGQAQNGRGQQGQNGQGQNAQGQNAQGQNASGQNGRGEQGQNGRGQAQGQNGQGEGRGEGREGSPNGGQGGGAPNGGRASGSSSGSLSQGELEQLSRELRQRLQDAQDLRRDLVRQGLDVSQLDRAIGGIRSLTDERILADERAAADLRAQTIDGLKAFEFALRKKLGAEDAKVLLGRTGDVPASFKQYVEEYYRSLAKSKDKDK